MKPRRIAIASHEALSKVEQIENEKQAA